MTTAFQDRQIGNYRVIEKLGEGGMGTVYLARVVKAKRGLRADAEVALKILHPHLANPDLVKRFEREGGIGQKLRHPRVMRIHDVGAETHSGVDVHFMAMQRLRGKTLRSVLDEAKTLPIERVLQLGHEIADGLAAIHDAGAVHRDIKPANVFVEDDGHAVIADLGLSRLLEPRTEISLPGTFLGSIAYAAPEQLEGFDVGPEADLYALGVLLYEMASGKNPFHGDDLKTTMHAHANLVAPPLSRTAPGVTYLLERVVSALLEKKPEFRLKPARRVADILTERERSEWWRQYVAGETGIERLSKARRQLKVTRVTRVHGRERELETIVDALRTATIGRSGRVVVVAGEAGAGKTRLVDAALEEAEVGAFPTNAVVSRFLDVATPLPYFALNEALLFAFELKTLPREQRREKLIESLREHLIERRVFAEAFAALIDDREPEQALSQLPKDAIPALYAEVIRTLSIKTALILVLENLQFADAAALKVLESLVRSVAMFPIALVFTVRTSGADVVDPTHPHTEFLKVVQGVREAVWVGLDRLSGPAVAGIVRDLGVPRRVEKPLAERLHSASEGNPAFLFALIEDLERRGRLHDPQPSHLRQLPIPNSIAELLSRRLEDVDPQARAFLEFASVFGPRFKIEPVVEGLGLDFTAASQIVSRLVDRYRMIRAFDQAYRFDHHMLREQVYARLQPAAKQKHHLRVAQMLAKEAAHAHEATRAAYEAGVHYSIAEEHGPAARYLVGAAKFLVARNQHERAERLANTAVQHAEKAAASGAPLAPEDVFALHQVRASIAGHLGHREAQGDSLVVAARAAHDLGRAAEIAESEVMLARFNAVTARTFAAVHHAERARMAAIESGDPSLEAAALRVKAEVQRFLGDPDCENVLRQADELARKAGDETGRAFGMLLLGQYLLSTDRAQEALRTFKEALKSFEELEDDRGRSRAFFHIARAYREIGDVARGAKAVDVAEHVATACSDQVQLARCQYLQGDLALRRREYDVAISRLEQAIAGLAGDDDPAYEVYSHIALALTYSARQWSARDPAKAVVHASAAVKRAQQLGLERQEAYAYTVLAFAHLAADAPQFALAVSRKGLKFVESGRAGKKRAAETLFVHYRCLKKLKRKEEAAEYLARAFDFVLERAAEFEDSEKRRLFLDVDMFNAAVVREARKVLKAQM